MFNARNEIFYSEHWSCWFASEMSVKQIHIITSSFLHYRQQFFKDQEKRSEIYRTSSTINITSWLETNDNIKKKIFLSVLNTMKQYSTFLIKYDFDRDALFYCPTWVCYALFPLGMHDLKLGRIWDLKLFDEVLQYW